MKLRDMTADVTLDRRSRWNVFRLELSDPSASADAHQPAPRQAEGSLANGARQGSGNPGTDSRAAR